MNEPLVRDMSRLKILRCFALLVLVPAFVALSDSPNKEVHTATEIRLLDPGWWPTKGTPARDEYVGSVACAKCHADKAETQKNSAMAHALVSASAAVPQQVSHGPLGFRISGYSYDVAQTANGPSYSVSNGSQSLSVPLKWAFGNGEFGQTYMFEQNGFFYESR